MENQNENEKHKEQEVEQEAEEYEVLKKDYEFIAPSQHEWRQRGPYLVCVSCELQHAVYIGMERILIGKDEEGKPILKNRKDVLSKG